MHLIKLAAFVAAAWALLAAAIAITPGPSDAEVRGPAKTVTWGEEP